MLNVEIMEKECQDMMEFELKRMMGAGENPFPGWIPSHLWLTDLGRP